MSKKKNLSEQETAVPNAQDLKFGIVVSEWNPEITEALYSGAYNALIENGAEKKNIIRKNVPGSFELTKGAALLAEYTDVDAIITLGCVIQGETRHFDFICSGVSNGITRLNIEYNLPFIFGVLTTDTFEQAKDRAGGKHGNKGIEAAVTAIKMADLQRKMEDAGDE